MQPIQLPTDPARLANHPTLRAAEDEFLAAVARVFWDDLNRRTTAQLALVGVCAVGPTGGG